MLLIERKNFFKILIINFIFLLIISFAISYFSEEMSKNRKESFKLEILKDLRTKIINDDNFEKDIKNASNIDLENISKNINLNHSISIFNLNSIKIFLVSFLILLFLQMINYNYIKIFQKRYVESIDNFINSVIDKKFDVNFESFDEGIISRLNNRFNKLGMAIKKNYINLEEDKLKIHNALADISHQIKTPLAALSMYNEILINSNELSEDNLNFLELSKNQITKLNWLISSLLILEKFNAKTIQFKPEKFEIGMLSEDFEFIFLKNLRNKNLRIKQIGDLDKFVYLDFKWTKEALLNIVKNATEHAYKNTEIEIEYIVNIAMIKIIVRNIGENISNEDLVKIFKRFYKNKNSELTESVGIGLNLSKNIIEGQSGIISVENTYNGVQFNITFIK